MKAPARFPHEAVWIDSGVVPVAPGQPQRISTHRLNMNDRCRRRSESRRPIAARRARTFGSQELSGQHRLVAVGPLDQKGAVLQDLATGGHVRHLGYLATGVSRNRRTALRPPKKSEQRRDDRDLIALGDVSAMVHAFTVPHPPCSRDQFPSLATAPRDVARTRAFDAPQRLC